MTDKDAKLVGLKAAIRFVADLAIDTEKVIAAGGSPLAALFIYKNLIPDIIALAPHIGSLPNSVRDLAPEDYIELVRELVKDLAITDAHAGAVISSGLAVLQELFLHVIPKVQALASAVKAPHAEPTAVA